MSMVNAKSQTALPVLILRGVRQDNFSRVLDSTAVKSPMGILCDLEKLRISLVDVDEMYVTR